MTRPDRVVLLDEDHAIREVARLFLEFAGFEVCSCETLDVALVQLRRQDVDAAILDFDIERREGMQVADAICRSDELDGCAVIAVAFDLRKVDLELVDRAIAKPYATTELATIVRDVIVANRVWLEGDRGGE